MGKELFDLAGFTNEWSRLGKKIDGLQIPVPAQIDLNPATDELVWSYTAHDPPYVPHKSVKATPQILDRFVHLWRGNPEAILKFARSWGVLAPDSHGRPGVLAGPPERREPLALWRYFSHRANAALNIAAALNQGRVGTLEDWGCLKGLREHSGDFCEEVSQYTGFFSPAIWNIDYPFDSPAFKTRKLVRKIEHERSFIAGEANLWLRLGRVGFTVWPADDARFQINVDCGFCLLGAIAFQLALTLCSAESFFTCSGCGRPYLRRKKLPKPGESNFCESCAQSGVALRNADRRRRKRIQESRQLRSNGVAIPEIAKKLGVRSSLTVRRWIEKRK
jgi:hypothetical protein